jgi:hypothetical protein
MPAAESVKRPVNVSLGALVALLALAVGFYRVQTNPQWAFDGYVYGIRAQTDAGIPYATALERARATYKTKPSALRPLAQESLHSETPMWWDLFAVRAIYPALASLLWPYAGFQSLFYVSVAAYAAAALVLYALFLRFSAPALAASIALACMLQPEAQLMARSNLTDMLAFAFLAAALLCAMRYAERGYGIDLAWFAFASALLSFTRPIPYELACAVAPLAFTTAWRRGANLTAVSLALCLAVAATMHLAGASVPPVDDYAHAVLAAGWVTAVWFIESIAASVALIALYATRGRADVAICIGALGSIVLTILANPVSSDIARVVIFPSLIPLGCGCAIAAQAALARGRAYATGTSIVGEWSGSESILAAPRRKSSRLA